MTHDMDSHAILDSESRRSKARKISAVLHDFGSGLEGRQVLDIGTGSGVIAAYLAAHARLVVSVDVVDERTQCDVPFLLLGNESLPFKLHVFDVVISNHVIEHVSRQVEHLQEIQRVLVPGGVCYLATPNRRALVENHYNLPLLSWLPPSIASRYLKLVKGRRYNIQPLTYSQLAGKATEAGFSVRDISLDLMKHPERYAMGSGFAWRGISLLPRWLLSAMHAILPTYVLLLRKPSLQRA